MYSYLNFQCSLCWGDAGDFPCCVMISSPVFDSEYHPQSGIKSLYFYKERQYVETSSVVEITSFRIPRS